MIVLTNTDKIQVKLSGAVTLNQLECFASYRDTTTNSITPARNAINTNGTTPVDLVGSPASSTERIVDYLSIYNSDSASAIVTVQYDAGGTAYSLIVTELSFGEKLEYQEGIGFRSLNIAGALKQASEIGFNGITGFNSVVLASNVINSNPTQNTLEDVTGLEFSVVSGNTYWFKFIIPYSVSSASAGTRWTINGPTASALYYELMNTTNGGAFGISTGMSTYNLPASWNTATSLTVGNVAIIEGIVTLSANGSIIARSASEVGGVSITAMAGAVVYYKQLN
jgi:hypothetical protein